MLFLTKTPYLLKSFYPKQLVWNKSRAERVIYLTFDDGPIPIVTPWVIKTLKKFNAKATFFCIGDNIVKHPQIFEQLKADGHAIGNHTFNHLKGWNTDDETYLANVLKCQQLTQTNFFRPPYGRIKKSQIKLLLLESQDDFETKEQRAKNKDDLRIQEQRARSDYDFETKEQRTKSKDDCETKGSNIKYQDAGRIKEKREKNKDDLQGSRPDSYRDSNLKSQISITMWDVLSGDFDPSLSPEKCLGNVLKHTENGSIVVFHDSLKAWDKLEYVLPKVLEIWSEEGFEFGLL